MNTELLKKIRLDIAKLDALTSLELPECGSWPESVHQFDKDSINALKAALAAQRPLLLRGDPGTGKSQLARAAAIALNRLFVYDVVNAHSESQELLWRFDAVGRLAEAQALAQGASEEERKKALNSRHYISPGPLWWALDWTSAHEVYEESRYQLNTPEKPERWQQQDGSVLLIDEIDKANSELPNGLLEIMANNCVAIPWLQTTIGGNNTVPPLVIITTNEERELPAAFIRRCLVLELELPKEDAAFLKLLTERGQLHYGSHCTLEICQLAAWQLLDDRKLAQDKGISNLPGQAEYLDMLRALSILADNDEARQKTMLDDIKKFIFCKYPAMYGR